MWLESISLLLGYILHLAIIFPVLYYETIRPIIRQLIGLKCHFSTLNGEKLQLSSNRQKFLITDIHKTYLEFSPKIASWAMTPKYLSSFRSDQGSYQYRYWNEKVIVKSTEPQRCNWKYYDFQLLSVMWHFAICISFI